MANPYREIFRAPGSVGFVPGASTMKRPLMPRCITSAWPSPGAPGRSPAGNENAVTYPRRTIGA